MLTRSLARVAMLAIFPVAAHAQALDPAISRIENYGHQVAEVARESGAFSFKGRMEHFVPVVLENYDVDGSLALIAGPAWARASASEKSAALAAFTRNSAIQHAENFHSPGFVLQVDRKVASRGPDRLVRAHIGTETLVYRLRESAGKWRIIDVVARGVSQLAVQRADFAQTVERGGVAALTAKLNEINARPR